MFPVAGLSRAGGESALCLTCSLFMWISRQRTFSLCHLISGFLIIRFPFSLDEYKDRAHMFLLGDRQWRDGILKWNIRSLRYEYICTEAKNRRG
ncbi:uncharacterized protein LOC119318259 isoform X2 [Triticum dicoccoides]|uniref:uncharacterized protein LOC119318259 isoform X2 n=1 Tax=Triticum dicoccoides TaxID=85692 RepID=UPI001890BB5A|nr:uncharacterized protein LOC119318259 isoform X2 [Triticum dicoccoides]